MKRINYVLIFIFALGFLLRTIDLANHPAGFTPDEASFGYDAYSLVHTGRDQWGNPWPLVLKSFGDYKMPLYSYLAIPSVLIFGLNEVSVRFPNALLGSVAILATYLLTKETFNKKIALSVALLLALSPWHIPLSRGAFEANLTTLFLPLGVYFTLKARKDPKFIALAALCFGLNLFTYHSARLVTPFVVLALISSQFDEIRKSYRRYLTGIIIFLIFSLVGLYTLLLGSGARAATSSIFASGESILHERIGSIAVGEPLLIAKVFNNKATYLLDKISSNYFSYFSPEFLFINGPREGTYGMVPGMGVLYSFEFITMTFAVVLIITKKVKIPLWLSAWILLSPIPAALSVGPGMAANRAAIMMPAIQIFSGIGLYFIYRHIEKYYKNYALAGMSLILVVSVAVFFENYWFWQPAKHAQAMIFGSREVVKEVEEISELYSNIIVTKTLSEPHIFVAFYNKVDPLTFQSASRNWEFEKFALHWVDQLPSYSLGKYTFKNIDWSTDIENEDTLIIVPPDNIPTGVNVINTIHYPNSTPAYVIVDNKHVDFAAQ